MAQLYNQTLDDEVQMERIESFTGGMDGFTRATLLPPDASQYLENVVILDNCEMRTRPGTTRLGSTFAAAVQGLFYFDTPSVEQLIAVSGGVFYQWDGNAWAEMTGFTVTDSPVVMAQCVDTALVTDGTTMRIWDGSSFGSVLGTGADDPPAGATILLFHAGRMWAAGFSGVTAGKENDALWGSLNLQFGDGAWDETKRQFRVGGGEGDPIVGLASLAPTSAQGFLMGVLKQNSIWLLNTLPTDDFTNYTATNTSQKMTDGIGCVGKRAYCVFGNDLLFVSPDKTIRSLARMEAATGQYEISPPLSLPMQPWMDRINWDYAHLIAARKYRELAFFSVPLDSSTTPNTVLVWNGRLQRWSGVWTNFNASCFEVTRFGGNTALVFADAAGNVRRWKDAADRNLDSTYLDDDVPIPTKGWTRSFLFSEPLCDKDLFHAELRFSLSNGIVTITLVADNSDLKTWTVDARQLGPDLPVDLPFDLVSSINKAARRGLRGLRPFNECYLKVESTEGWWSLRNVSLSAFINTIRNQ